jgi:hypothetical protein
MNTGQWDGWEHAHCYDWLLEQAAQGCAAVVMPDVVAEDGSALTFCHPAARALLDDDAAIRVAGVVAFAVAAHGVCAAESDY